MGTQDNARDKFTLRQHFRDADLLGYEPANINRAISEFAYTEPEAFKALVKAIAPTNIALENQILRSWGIR